MKATSIQTQEELNAEATASARRLGTLWSAAQLSGGTGKGILVRIGETMISDSSLRAIEQEVQALFTEGPGLLDRTAELMMSDTDDGLVCTILKRWANNLYAMPSRDPCNEVSLRAVWTSLHWPEAPHPREGERRAPSSSRWRWEGSGAWASDVLQSRSFIERASAEKMLQYVGVQVSDEQALRNLAQFGLPCKDMVAPLGEALAQLKTRDRSAFADMIERSGIMKESNWWAVIAQNPELGIESLFPARRIKFSAGEPLPKSAQRIFEKSRHPLGIREGKKIRPGAERSELREVAAQVFGLLKPAELIGRVVIDPEASAADLIRFMGQLEAECRSRNEPFKFLQGASPLWCWRDGSLEMNPLERLHQLLLDRRNGSRSIPGAEVDASRIAQEWRQVTQDLRNGALTVQDVNFAFEHLITCQLYGWVIEGAPRDQVSVQVSRVQLALTPGIKGSRLTELNDLDRQILTRLKLETDQLLAAAWELT